MQVRKTNLERFQTNFEYQKYRNNILRCDNIKCVIQKENQCIKYCKSLNPEEFDTCLWLCKKKGDIKIKDYLWQNAIFGEAIDHFNENR
tara:strand:+ start:31783 stop:32049 length:267 start_codon:yes stop_codon:yes gene_type:complete